MAKVPEFVSPKELFEKEIIKKEPDKEILSAICERIDPYINVLYNFTSKPVINVLMERGFVDQVRIIYDIYPESVKNANPYPTCKFVNNVDEYIKMGFDIHKKDIFKNLILFEKIDMIDSLLDYIENIDLLTFISDTIIHILNISGKKRNPYKKIILILLEKGANPNIPDPNGDIYMHKMVYSEDILDIMEVLVKYTDKHVYNNNNIHCCFASIPIDYIFVKEEKNNLIRWVKVIRDMVTEENKDVLSHWKYYPKMTLDILADSIEKHINSDDIYINCVLSGLLNEKIALLDEEDKDIYKQIYTQTATSFMDIVSGDVEYYS